MTKHQKSPMPQLTPVHLIAVCKTAGPHSVALSCIVLTEVRQNADPPGLHACPLSLIRDASLVESPGFCFASCIAGSCFEASKIRLTQELDACGVERVLGHGHQDAVLVVPDDRVQHVAHRWGRSVCQENLLHPAEEHVSRAC